MTCRCPTCGQKVREPAPARRVSCVVCGAWTYQQGKGRRRIVCSHRCWLRWRWMKRNHLASEFNDVPAAGIQSGTRPTPARSGSSVLGDSRAAGPEQVGSVMARALDGVRRKAGEG